jgi:acetyl esterase/lipase
MTFSKSVVRPWQIPLLLDKGILPVSIDYRLCPEVGVDVAMEDVRDSLVWARNVLPSIIERHKAVVDPERVVMIGWSTGATLAMSAAWTAVDIGVKPPAGILNFYGPSDFEHPCKFPFANIAITATKEKQVGGNTVLVDSRTRQCLNMRLQIPV